MSLFLSQKNTFSLGALERRLDRHLLNLFSRARKVLRLRQKHPQWFRIALLILIGDIVLAASVWIAVDFLR